MCLYTSAHTHTHTHPNIHQRFLALYLADATTPWRLGVCASRGNLPFPSSKEREQRVLPLNPGREERGKVSEPTREGWPSERERAEVAEDKLERGGRAKGVPGLGVLDKGGVGRSVDEGSGQRVALLLYPDGSAGRERGRQSSRCGRGGGRRRKEEGVGPVRSKKH